MNHDLYIKFDNLSPEKVKELMEVLKPFQPGQMMALPVPVCMYCKKSAAESGKVQMTVNAPGTYLQCYDFRLSGDDRFCKENTQKINPMGEKEQST